MSARATFLALIGAASFAVSAAAQTSVGVPVANPWLAPTLAANPDFCVNTMASFPRDDQEARFAFFRLTEEMARDVTPDFARLLVQYGDANITDETSMLKVIEDIANPVLRQAAPEITVGSMAHVIDFAKTCEPYITGQIDSLIAFNGAFADAEFNAVITEDALFLRQVLSDSLGRLGADTSPAAQQYQRALITTRDAVEFSTFESEIDEIEALFMEDLDGRLARSNDMINAEMDREVLGDSVALSDSLNKAAKKRQKQEQVYTLIRILGGGG